MFGSLLALGIPIVQVAFYQSYQVQMIQACDYWCTDQLMANQTNTGIWKKVVDIQTKVGHLVPRLTKHFSPSLTSLMWC